MTSREEHEAQPIHPRCCPCGDHAAGLPGVTRRDFLRAGGIAMGGVALTGLAWSALQAEEMRLGDPLARKPLVVKPILMFEIPRRRDKTSWRSWGGIQTQQDADAEVKRIQDELEKLKADADFPVEFLPVAPVRGPGDLGKLDDLQKADTVLLYAAGGPQNILGEVVKTGKHVVFFLRHKSGPVYLWYEIISPRYLRQHTDRLAVKGVDDGDVVVDSVEELSWRLRSLGGL